MNSVSLVKTGKLATVAKLLLACVPRSNSNRRTSAEKGSRSKSCVWMKMRSLVGKEEGIRASSKEVTDFRGKKWWWQGS